MEKEIEELKIEERIERSEGKRIEVEGRGEKGNAEREIEGWKERIKRLEKGLEKKKREEKKYCKD